jgi:hypothetical protein
MLQTDLHLHVALSRRTKWAKPGNLQQNTFPPPGKSGSIVQEGTFSCIVVFGYVL